MKRNKKSVSVKNTKSFLGNVPALVNTTFFVPAANLNSNDGIFTDLHDYPSNFSPSNQDPNWQFDISNKIFAQSNKKKIFSDDKFMNMISKMPDVYDTYTSDLFTGDFAPVENYSDVVRAVSPVLSEINYPTYQSDVDLQPVSVGIAPVDSDYFAPSMVYRDTYMNAEVLRQAEQSNSDYFISRQVDSNLGSSTTDADLIKLIGQEKFDSQVASNYQDAVLSSPPDSPEMGDVEVLNVKDPLSDSNNVSTASIQPLLVSDDKKGKKPYNWLPLLLVVAAVGGYMYYNRKK
jgi:hypothetical protein